MTEATLRRLARVLAWASLGLGALGLLAAIIKGANYAPALAGIAIGLAVLVATRSPVER